MALILIVTVVVQPVVLLKKTNNWHDVVDDMTMAIAMTTVTMGLVGNPTAEGECEDGKMGRWY